MGDWRREGLRDRSFCIGGGVLLREFWIRCMRRALVMRVFNNLLGEYTLTCMKKGAVKFVEVQ